MGKSRISLQTFAFGGRNKPMKPYSQLDSNSTNPLWKQIIMKFVLEYAISSASVSVEIHAIERAGNLLHINQQKSAYMSDSNSTDKICASTLQQVPDTSHASSISFTISPGASKFVVLTPTFACKSNASESHRISITINGVEQARYPIRIYGPRSGQRSRFLKKEYDSCQPSIFLVESSENLEPNGGGHSSSGMLATLRLSSSQGLRLNSSTGLPLTYEGMELESLADAKPSVVPHTNQTSYPPMLDDEDNHYVTPDPCSDIARPWNSVTGYSFYSGQNPGIIKNFLGCQSHA